MSVATPGALYRARKQDSKPTTDQDRSTGMLTSQKARCEFLLRNPLERIREGRSVVELEGRIKQIEAELERREKNEVHAPELQASNNKGDQEESVPTLRFGKQDIPSRQPGPVTTVFYENGVAVARPKTPRKSTREVRSRRKKDTASSTSEGNETTEAGTTSK